MWCNRCKQDVPGVADGEQSQELRCARCGESHMGKSPLKNSVHEFTGDPAPFDDFETPWADDFDAAEGLLAAFGAQSAEEPPSPDARSPEFRSANLASRYEASPQGASRPHRPLHGGVVSWAMILLSVATFVCGGVLLVWSFVTHRADLWQYGLPLTLAGQAGLFIGVLLQLDGLSQTSRESSRTLNDLDEQLHDLRHATTLLSRTHSGASQSFYAHLAEGASPHLLLSDLKGQLDLLATQMEKQRRRSDLY